MSAMETMLRTVFNSMGFDPEEIKSEATKRINQFEENVRILNSSLISINQRLERIEKHFAIEQPTTKPEQIENDPNRNAAE